MTSFRATPKGLVRGAVIDIEETLQQRSIGDLAEQERATVLTDAQAIIDTLTAQGMTDMLDPERKTLQEALKDMNTVLDVADGERRQLTPVEGAIVIHAARAILLLFQGKAGPADQ